MKKITLDSSNITLLFFEFEIGFNFGSVFWDDEDLLNANYHGGTVPSGSFGRDTRINYCCRYIEYYF